jgi:hypothetical protein
MIYKIAYKVFDIIAPVFLPNQRSLKVLAGPFKGMKYISHSVGSSLFPKIFGTYEKELDKFISDIGYFPKGFDIGAAEGYYAVGLLHKKICDSMVAWETTAVGRKLLKNLAAVNNVQNQLEIRGMCTSVELAKELDLNAMEKSLVVVDCEGFEGVLFAGIEPSLLLKCALIIETHDFLNPGVHERLVSLLSPSHNIKEIEPQKRSASDLLLSLPGILKIFKIPVIRRIAISERRCPDIKWIVAEPKKL